MSNHVIHVKSCQFMSIHVNSCNSAHLSLDLSGNSVNWGEGGESGEGSNMSSQASATASLSGRRQNTLFLLFYGLAHLSDVFEPSPQRDEDQEHGRSLEKRHWRGALEKWANGKLSVILSRLVPGFLLSLLTIC
jgi:hypothetical protein